MKSIKHFFTFLLISCLCITLISCGRSKKNLSSNHSATYYKTSTEIGTRNNIPEVLIPTASGETVYSCDVSTIDTSNSSEGYIMVNYTGSNPKVKLQITGPDQITYTYDLHGEYEVFPLTAQSGTYTASVFENISGTEYSTTLSKTFDVKITNEFGPYLYPNQYVNFTADSLAVAFCPELLRACSTDIEVIQEIYNYIIDNFTYDYDKAKNVQSGYLPDIDKVFKSNSGICFDYASVMASMLRSERIPTRLEVGYMEEAYHAWISVYLEDKGWVNGIIEFDGKTWKLMDPTFASTSSSPHDFLPKDEKYITKFVY